MIQTKEELECPICHWKKFKILVDSSGEFNEYIIKCDDCGAEFGLL